MGALRKTNSCTDLNEQKASVNLSQLITLEAAGKLKWEHGAEATFYASNTDIVSCCSGGRFVLVSDLKSAQIGYNPENNEWTFVLFKGCDGKADYIYKEAHQELIPIVNQLWERLKQEIPPSPLPEWQALKRLRGQ